MWILDSEPSLLLLFEEPCQVDVLTPHANGWNPNHCFPLGLFVSLLKSQDWIHDVSPVLFTVHVLSHPGWFSYTLEPNTFLPCKSLWVAKKPKLMVILRNPGLLFIVSWTASSGRVLRGGLIQTTGYLAAEQNDTQRDIVIWRFLVWFVNRSKN